MDKEDVHIYSGKLLSRKKKDIMPFAATWVDLEIIILNEVSQRKTNIIEYHWYEESNFLNDTNELIYETETNFWLPKGKCRGEGKSRAWDIHAHTTIYIR